MFADRHCQPNHIPSGLLAATPGRRTASLSMCAEVWRVIRTRVVCRLDRGYQEYLGCLCRVYTVMLTGLAPSFQASPSRWRI